MYTSSIVFRTLLPFNDELTAVQMTVGQGYKRLFCFIEGFVLDESETAMLAIHFLGETNTLYCSKLFEQLFKFLFCGLESNISYNKLC